MQIVKMANHREEIDRSQLIMTPNQQQIPPSDLRTEELDQSKGDLSNASHYYRFKKHSLGY